MRIGDVEVRIDAANTHYLALLRAGAEGYEAETAALLERLVPDDGIFFDVGANWGPFSLLIASRPGFTGQVVAFEPVARVREDLASVIAQAGLSSRITLRAEALSDRAGRGAMRYKLHSALATIEPGAGDVTMARLDDLDLPAPHVLKIDVEGHEAAVLDGAREMIARHRPLIVLESRPQDGDRALGWLRAKDYRVDRLGSDFNVFARPAERPDPL
jgi:FkbM family methyltransferase